jgi:O-antigen/teichoic acid export membrane protein
VPAIIATDRSTTGRVLGTALLWRGFTAFLVYWLLLASSEVLGYPREVKIVISLYFVGYTISTLTNACQSVMVGFEHVEVAAYRQVLEQFAEVVIVVPILVMGWGLNMSLVGHALAAMVSFVYVRRTLRFVDVGHLSVDFQVLRTIVHRGTPFVFLSVAMVLQPTIDAAFLSKLSQADVVGWYSAARRLLGFLLFPAASIVGALYPTLCRLRATDTEEFARTASTALRATSLLVVPVALGCVFYPQIGIALYNRSRFGPAEDDLRILGVFLFLLYFSMPVGITIIAAGKERSWALVQLTSVILSLILDPLLIPRFQQRAGNGGLGLCVASVVSELVVLAIAYFLVPPGIFTYRFWRSLAPAAISGAAMAGAALALSSIAAVVAAPVAVVVYAACLWATGGIDPELAHMLAGPIRRKLAR